MESSDQIHDVLTLLWRKLVEVRERNTVQRRLFDYFSLEAEFAARHQRQPDNQLASKNECKIANEESCIRMGPGTISIERLVEDDALVADCYAYSTCRRRRRLVNDGLGSGEQVGRSWVVDSFMREDGER